MSKKIWFHKSNDDYRYWLHFGNSHCLSLELAGFRSKVGIGISEYDDRLTLHITIFFSIYLSTTWPRWIVKKMQDREIAIDFHDGNLWIKPFSDTMGWRRSDPWWKRGITLHIQDWLLGKAKYSFRELSQHKVNIDMPEKVYEATIKLTEDTWKKRWYWPRYVLKRARIEVEGGIPVPGKGENSWDCGEDATHGLTCPANNLDEAIAAIKKSVTERRLRYGGTNWKPENKTLPQGGR